MDYELYHDESLEGEDWHGMLLVPAENKKEISDLLIKARNNTRYFDKIGIKKVDRKGLISNCASPWTQIGVACLRSSTKGHPEPVFLGLQGLKFILFCDRDVRKQRTGYTYDATKTETTFLFGTKGRLHLRGSDETPINITRMHFDGYKHHKRHIDKDRIIERLGSLCQYCTISNRHDLIDDRQGDHKKPESQEYGDCQFLQLTELLIGCFRASLGYEAKARKLNIIVVVQDSKKSNKG